MLNNNINVQHSDSRPLAVVIVTDKEVVFGTPLTEGGIAQIYQLIEYLSKSELIMLLQFPSEA